jgi:hypothetical protein
MRCLTKAQCQHNHKTDSRQSNGNTKDRRKLYDAPEIYSLSNLKTDREPFESIASRLKFWAGLSACPEAVNDGVHAWLIGKAEDG